MNGKLVYQLLDVLFVCFHVALILFNLFGWLFKKFRKWNFITLAITAFSWIILGFFYGFGYCFLTDWHWSVRKRLGYTNESNSYIHFLIAEITGVQLSERVVDTLTAVLFFAALFISAALNFHPAFARKRR